MPVTITREDKVVVEGTATVRVHNNKEAVLFEGYETDDHKPKVADLFASAALWLQENEGVTIIATDMQYSWEDGYYICLMLVVE